MFCMRFSILVRKKLKTMKGYVFCKVVWYSHTGWFPWILALWCITYSKTPKRCSGNVVYFPNIVCFVFQLCFFLYQTGKRINTQWIYREMKKNQNDCQKLVIWVLYTKTPNCIWKPAPRNEYFKSFWAF